MHNQQEHPHPQTNECTYTECCMRQDKYSGICKIYIATSNLRAYFMNYYIKYMVGFINRHTSIRHV